LKVITAIILKVDRLISRGVGDLDGLHADDQLLSAWLGRFRPTELHDCNVTWFSNESNLETTLEFGFINYTWIDYGTIE
jgi:hypothetical protein